MSKVLKVVGAVAAVASVIATAGASLGFIAAGSSLLGLGISAAGFSAIALGASLGASVLAKKPRAPANSPEAYDRLRASIIPRTARKTVVGVTALATDIRDEEFTDEQTYFHRFIVCASHKVNAITEIWFDDKVAWTSTGGVQGEFVGYLTVATRTEGSAANAINISSRMGSTRRYTGLAYVHLRYKLTGNSKKTDSPFAQSVTTRITIRGEGAAIYDPRLDSNVAGGSGSHDPADQATWIWDEDAARNPALQLLFYLLGYKINGILAIGKGIPANRIDLESFAVAANICDEMVATEAGGTEPRYRSDGIWSEADSPGTVIDMLKATMNADLDDVGGKLRLTIFHNDLATPDADFTDADILDGFEWEKTPPLDQTFNVVSGVYTNPSDTALYQPMDYPRQEVASPDGIERADTFDLPMVQSADQAQRLAALRLNRMTYGAGVFRAEFQATAWKVQKNSIVRLTFAQTGFVEKLFRVAEMEIRQDGVVPMVLREESASIYGAPTLAAPVDPVGTTPYDPSKNPFVVGASSARVFRTKTVNYPLSSDDTSITIAAFDGVLDDGRSLSLAGDTITGLTSGVSYLVFYDIAAGTYSAVASPALAQVADSGLAYIDEQSTSDAGTYPDPEPPPPGYCVADDTPILMADGTEVPAGDLVVGSVLRTRHERTMAWGDWPVLAIEFVDEPVFACALTGENGQVMIRATGDHLFMISNRWVRARGIGEADGVARVAKITVAEAHTYVSNGVLSHNIKAGGGLEP